MKIRNQSNIKYGLFFFALIICGIIFWLNRQTVNNLRNDTRAQVVHLAQSYNDAINNSNDEAIRFILDIMLPAMDFPIIITTNNEIYSTMNIDSPYKIKTDEYNSYMLELATIMDKTFAPLDIKWKNIDIGKIHYSDSEIIGQISLLPYLELGFLILFLLLGLWGLQLIRNSENSNIYAGMARETAHQLGTPISSLMGWSKLLEDSKSNKDEILSYINEEIFRLSSISDRFSKIGSKIKYSDVNLYDIFSKISRYFDKRISNSSRIQIKLKCEKNNIVNGDKILLSWAFENILKNSIDSIKMDRGVIVIEINKNKNQYIIDITDSGNGILRKDWKNVFKPGFSTKKRGWGLGLSLTKRIIEDMHHGKISVYKSLPGETTIRVLL